MPDSLVRVATYANLPEAEMARNYLAAENVRAVLVDTETAALNWHIAQAIGGVKLMVHVDDEDRAVELLEDQVRRRVRNATADEAHDESQAIASEGDLAAMDPPADEQGDEPSEREIAAERAFRAQIISFLFFPLQLYALLMIATVAGSRGRLEGKPLHHRPDPRRFPCRRPAGGPSVEVNRIEVQILPPRLQHDCKVTAMCLLRGSKCRTPATTIRAECLKSVPQEKGGVAVLIDLSRLGKIAESSASH